MALPRFLRALVCLLLGHRPVRGAAVFAPATLQIHQLDGRVVQRAASTRTFPVTCARCGTSLPFDLVIDSEEDHG